MRPSRRTTARPLFFLLLFGVQPATTAPAMTRPDPADRSTGGRGTRSRPAHDAQRGGDAALARMDGEGAGVPPAAANAGTAGACKLEARNTMKVCRVVGGGAGRDGGAQAGGEGRRGRQGERPQLPQQR